MERADTVKHAENDVAASTRPQTVVHEDRAPLGDGDVNTTGGTGGRVVLGVLAAVFGIMMVVLVAWLLFGALAR